MQRFKRRVCDSDECAARLKAEAIFLAHRARQLNLNRQERDFPIKFEEFPETNALILADQPLRLRLHPCRKTNKGLELLLIANSVKRDARAFGEQPLQVERRASRRAGTGQSFPAEGLNPDHGANHVPVDVDISGAGGCRNCVDRFVDAGMNAKRKAVTGAIDLGNKLVQAGFVEAADMKDRAEYFARKLAKRIYADKGRRDEIPRCASIRNRHLKKNTVALSCEVGFKTGLGLCVDNWADIG